MIGLIKKFQLNTDTLAYEVVNDPDIYYFGPILDPVRINTLRRCGNTVIEYAVYEQLGEKTLKKEIKELTGLEVSVVVTSDKTVIINVNSQPILFGPRVVLDTTSNKTHYIIYLDGKELAKMSKKVNKLVDVKEYIAASGVAEYEVR